MNIPDFKQYAELADRTTSTGYQGDNADLIHGVLGASSEVGELADQVKRFMYYGKPLDTVNLCEEVGDVLWYLALIAKSSGFTLQQSAERNIAKLMVRFPGQFSNEAALVRDLLAERASLETKVQDAEMV